MVAEPPPDSIPCLTDSATAFPSESGVDRPTLGANARPLLTFSDMAVHSVDNNGDLRSSHLRRLEGLVSEGDRVTADDCGGLPALAL
jgi:hypothetical protein